MGAAAVAALRTDRRAAAMRIVGIAALVRAGRRAAALDLVVHVRALQQQGKHLIPRGHGFLPETDGVH